MEELCRNFLVSINTVRIDVKTLIAMGHVKKTYGGVAGTRSETSGPYVENGYPVSYGSYQSRIMHRFSQKQKIAEVAAGLICDEDIVYFDVGTTCLSIVDYIPKEYNVTVISHDLNIISRAVLHENIKLMTFGGTYHQRTNGFKCSFSALHSYLNTCNISKAFLGTTGVSLLGQMTNSENFGREIRISLLKTCPSCYLLADSSKFGKTALLTYGSLSDLTACISDEALPDEYRQLCECMGVDLKLAQATEGKEGTGE